MKPITKTVIATGFLLSVALFIGCSSQKSELNPQEPIVVHAPQGYHQTQDNIHLAARVLHEEECVAFFGPKGADMPHGRPLYPIELTITNHGTTAVSLSKTDIGLRTKSDVAVKSALYGSTFNAFTALAIASGLVACVGLGLTGIGLYAVATTAKCVCHYALGSIFLIAGPTITTPASIGTYYATKKSNHYATQLTAGDFGATIDRMILKKCIVAPGQTIKTYIFVPKKALTPKYKRSAQQTFNITMRTPNTRTTFNVAKKELFRS